MSDDPDLLHQEIARLHGVNDRLRAEIERLRSQPCPYVTGTVTQYCTLTPFTLTDAEREAIDYAWCSVGRDDAFSEQHASELRETLEQLLERTK